MEQVLSLSGIRRGGSSLRFKVHMHPLRETLRIGDLEIETAELPPAGNCGVRFRCSKDSVALTGDSAFHRHEVAFLHRVDLVVMDSGHLSDEEIVELAVRAEPGWILCSHVYRDLDARSLVARARSLGFSGRISVAEDRMVIEL